MWAPLHIWIPLILTEYLQPQVSGLGTFVSLKETVSLHSSPLPLLWLIISACSQKPLSGLLLHLLSYFIQMDLPDEEPDRLSNKLLQYDPSQDQWRERAPMRYSKYRFSAAVVNSEIYVLGKKQQIAQNIATFITPTACSCKSKRIPSSCILV